MPNVDKIIAVTNPDMWQQSGGLVGLIILALFIILSASVAIFGYVLMKIYEMQRNDVKEMVLSQSNERAAFNKMADDRQKETNVALNAMSVTIQGLSAAIHEMAQRSRRYEEK